MDIYDKTREIRELIRDTENWDESGFAWSKSYISALFSSLAYEEIPEFELKSSKRAKVIPCDSYQAHVSRWENNQKRATLRNLDSNIPFEVVTRRSVVVTAFQYPEVIFVAFRGTTISFSDFKADLDVRKAKYPWGFGESIKFHRGFFEAVLEAYDEVQDRLHELSKDRNVPVYVCGHSLGGAMAAIFHARANEDHHHPFGRRRNRHSRHSTACYTFGMPRYCDLAGKAVLDQPHHVFNELDAVPTLPPRLIGFVDAANEQCINAIPEVLHGISKGDFAFRKKDGKTTMLGASDHRMEKYIERVRVLNERTNLNGR
jgi:Lipase (class 3)